MASNERPRGGGGKERKRQRVDNPWVEGYS